MEFEGLDFDGVMRWLREEDPAQLSALYRRADEVSAACVGDEVHLRGLVEIGNYCGRNCHYCGIRKDNGELRRYRMTEDEIIGCARACVRLGYGTLVLQSGEDFGIRAAWLADILHRIKEETDLAITLSLGEREPWEWELWRQAGADRYLLKFETSNADLYARIHPARVDANSDRPAMLRQLRGLGFEIGSGAMVGLMGQGYEDLARDLLLFHELDLDMIGIGPYIPHSATPMGMGSAQYAAAPPDQVPATATMTYKAIALTRILCPHTNMPSTTALRTLDPSGLVRSLQCGANVIMPALTPLRYRLLYEIYPGKARLDEPEQAALYLREQLRTLGRTVGLDAGTSRRYLERTAGLDDSGPRKESVPC